MTWTTDYEFVEPLVDLRAQPEVAEALCAELTRELRRGHALHGRGLRVIARALPQDDVVVETDDGDVLLVHLTWTHKAETLPWPITETVGSAAEFERTLESRY